MIAVLRAIYKFHKERRKRGRVWINTTTSTIHVEGGNLTAAELYEECKKLLK